MTSLLESATDRSREVNLPLERLAKHPTVAFFGIFGVQNLGNECTLQAILANAAEQQPDAKLFSVSYDPEDTRQRHKITSVPVEASYAPTRSAGTVNRG